MLNSAYFTGERKGDAEHPINSVQQSLALWMRRTRRLWNWTRSEKRCAKWMPSSAKCLMNGIGICCIGGTSAAKHLRRSPLRCIIPGVKLSDCDDDRAAVPACAVRYS